MENAAHPRAICSPPKGLDQDLERLRQMIAEYKQGKLSAAQLQAFRVPQGVYEQREAGTFMLRVRLPAGVLLPHQMRRLAEVAKTYGNGVLHVTTRQDVQVHGVRVDAIYPALMALADAGLSTKGGGGNTVRNITTCPQAGVCPMETFDVAPHSVRMTEFLLADPLSYQLPRKYKIAFSGCSRDCAGATVNDLGFIAKRREGTEGFAVYAGGGLGAHSAVAMLLETFVPTEDAPLIAEAVKRVFDRHGDRRNKHRARLRFLVERIGFDAFRGHYERELAALREAPPVVPPVRPLPSPSHVPAAPQGAPADLGPWRRFNVVAQKQAGYFVVHIPLILGDIEAERLADLADVVERYGDGMLRATQWQNAALRWVPEDALPAVHGTLDALGLADATPPVLRDLVACAGASTCRLGICLSRGLAKTLAVALAESDLPLRVFDDLKIHISGCPNACGRHPVAPIGLHGAARRISGRLVPFYIIQLGGRVAEGRTKLAQGQVAVPARTVPAYLVGLLRAFQASEPCPDFYAFLDHGGHQVAEELAREYGHVPTFAENNAFYFDWGAEKVFSLAGRGPGECGAGVFDLIEVDLSSAAKALEEGRYFAAAALAARALLVTRGEEAVGDAQAFTLFQRHFLATGLVSDRRRGVVDEGLRAAQARNPEDAFRAPADETRALVDEVKRLYENLDASLRFVAPAKAGTAEAPAADTSHSDAARDFRGVACPLNYVKTKLALETLGVGQTLRVLLDEEGARNVPASAACEGHKVLSVTPKGDHWEVVVRKGK